MLKKAIQQGRSQRRGEAYASVCKPLSEARTLHGKRHVEADRGWAGEKSDFFSILLCAALSESRQVFHGFPGCRTGFDRRIQTHPRIDPIPQVHDPFALLDRLL
jgi:hypothetical protein